MDTATTVTLGLLLALIPISIIGITASFVLAGRPVKRREPAPVDVAAEERLAA